MKGKRHKMSVSVKGRADIEELSFLARLTKKLLRDPVKFEPPGKKMHIFTTSDLDPDGRIYPDYKKRRRRRKEAEEKTRPLRWMTQHDFKPDDNE